MSITHELRGALVSHEEEPESRIVQIAKHVRNNSFTRLKIGVAGNGGSFSEQAALVYLADRHKA